MTRLWVRICALAIAVGWTASALAQADIAPPPVHALAANGNPRYPAGFAYTDYVNPDAPKGGTLIESRIGSFDNLNPFILTAKVPDERLHLLFDTLMTRAWNEPYTLYALVAESATVPPDNSWIEFAIDARARFSDGAPITADDVIFSYETLMRWGQLNQRRVYSRITEARRIDDCHIRFALGGPQDRDTVMAIALMPVLDKHYWDGREFNRPTLEPPLESGPYRIAAVDPGRSMTFERRPDYWGRDLPINVGLYNFDTIRVDYYRDDGVALEAFKAGAYNFRWEKSDITKWMTGYDFPAARDGRVAREELPERRVDPVRALIFNTRRPLFADRRVRQALALAFDFEWMNQTLFAGAFRRIESYFPNSELAAEGPPSPAELALLEPFRAELPAETFGPAFRAPETDGSGDFGLRPNLRQAMALLQQAGWAVRDGRLVDGKTGRPFAFEILLKDPHDERVALPYAQALKRLGIAATVRTLDEPQFIQRRVQSDFDMIRDEWIETLSPGAEQAIYWSSKAADTAGSRNYAGIRSPAVDSLLAALGDAKDRRQLVETTHALDRVLSWGYYAIPLYYRGVDQVAYWRPICHPKSMPLWGITIEAWYSDPKGCDALASAPR